MDLIFTFRGHRVGVTAINQLQRYLITGDEEGTIMIWDVETYKNIKTYSKIIQSRIQSIKIIDDGHRHAAIFQSRDHGLHVYNIQDSTTLNQITIDLICRFPAHPSLFSKGDAIIHQNIGVVLGYASERSSQIVTVRNLDDDWNDLTTVDLERPVVGGNVFDIQLRAHDSKHDNIMCLIGYEDGKIAMFKLRSNQSTSPCFDIIMTRIVNVMIDDFVSAFDIYKDVHLIIGSPTRDLVIFCCDVDDVVRLKLDKRGISSIKCHWVDDWVAVSRWDSRVDIYSIDTRQILYSLNSHSKQVQDMIWLKTSFFTNYTKVLGCVSLDGTISLVGI